MTSSIDQAFQMLAAELPLAPEELLQRLGERGCRSWDEVVGLEPCRELPRMIARDVRSALPEDDVQAFVRAHQVGVFFGFVADRIADGEAEISSELLATREALASAWSTSLAEVVAPRTRAERAVRRVRRVFDRAVEMEQRSWRAGGLTPDAYAKITCAKLFWAGLATREFVAREAPELSNPFARLFRMLVGSLQLCDDAMDGEQDRRARGASAAEVLGVPAPALIIASSVLNSLSAQMAARAGLASLANWFELRTGEVAALAPQKDFASHLAAQALVCAFTSMSDRGGA